MTNRFKAFLLGLAFLTLTPTAALATLQGSPFPRYLDERFHAIEGGTTPAFTLLNNETLVNSTDDTVQVGSEDETITFRLLGFEAKSAILSLCADQCDDTADQYSLTADTSNVLTLKNGTTSLATWATTGDVSILGTTPYLTIGDAGAEDAGIVFDGHSGGVDWHISSDDSADDLVIGVGSAPDTTNRLVLDGGSEKMTLGAGTGDVDTNVVFNGTAQDYNISLDDSTDDLVIGLGGAAGTTDAIRIDENQDVTFVQNVVGLGTDSLSGFLQKQVAITTTTITAAQCGSTFVGDSADVIVLPEASTVLGCRLTFVSGTADDVDIDPADATDEFASCTVSGGTIDGAAGDEYRLTDIGTSLTIEAIGANLWACVAHNGPITDVN